MSNKTNFKVLLYYKYVEIKNPEEVMYSQKAICEKLKIKGRIIVAKEGINGTVEGKEKDVKKYIEFMRKSEYFSDVIFKISDGTGNAFPRLSVKVRSEVVTAGLPDLNPNKTTGKYLSHEELHSWFKEKKEFYIVDMRNDYEFISGHFEGSINPEFANFRDLPSILPKLDHLRNKTILTVCTGGIRCEKASGFLVENGFSDVYQLKDGIQTYMENYPNEHFKGKLYVFDGRITIGFNTDSENHEVIGKCDKCGVACDSYVNCENLGCHRHFICCEECRESETGLAFCNEDCKKRFIERNHSTVI